MKVQTTIAPGHEAHHPFGPASKPAAPAGRKKAVLDLSTLRVVDAEPPAKRSIQSRFDALFAGLQPGKALECAPEDVPRVSSALRAWVKRNERAGKVISSSSERVIKDGKVAYIGRVWLVED